VRPRSAGCWAHRVAVAVKAVCQRLELLNPGKLRVGLAGEGFHLAVKRGGHADNLLLDLQGWGGGGGGRWQARAWTMATTGRAALLLWHTVAGRSRVRTSVQHRFKLQNAAAWTAASAKHHLVACFKRSSVDGVQCIDGRIKHLQV